MVWVRFWVDWEVDGWKNEPRTDVPNREGDIFIIYGLHVEPVEGVGGWGGEWMNEWARNGSKNAPCSQ